MTTNIKSDWRGPVEPEGPHPDDPSSIQVYLCVSCAEIFKIVDLEPFDDVLHCVYCGRENPMNVTEDYFTPWGDQDDESC